MASARIQCPYCDSFLVLALAEMLYARDADFFLCQLCREVWHIAKGQDGPPSRELLGSDGVRLPDT
jgi:hypothetical protein